jgi:small subunit ribosomal protein S13
MVYLFESELPKNKQFVFALINLYGIGKPKASFLCKKLGFSRNLMVKDVSKEQLNKLVKSIESSNMLIAGDLLKSRLLLVKKLVSIKSYRGLRRYQGLPVRGQRTHTNAKTALKRFR